MLGKRELKKRIAEQCREIMKNWYIDESKYKIVVEWDDPTADAYATGKNGNVIQFNQIFYDDDTGEILQYCINF